MEKKLEISSRKWIIQSMQNNAQKSHSTLSVQALNAQDFSIAYF